MPLPVVIVLTEKTTEEILAAGGSQSWRLNADNARRMEFAVCARNRNRGGPKKEYREDHGAAFMVGKIRDVVPSERTGEWRIDFSEYAEVSVPGAWQGWRNPVHYATFEQLGIHGEKLIWSPMPELVASSLNPRAADGDRLYLTLAQAKEGLANTFGIQPDAIEIIIRG